jgi:hypothetical protein
LEDGEIMMVYVGVGVSLRNLDKGVDEL